MKAIKITASTRISQGSMQSGRLDESDIYNIVDQCVADAVEGSFGSFPAYWNNDIKLRGQRLGDVRIHRANDTEASVDFSFEVPSELFPVDGGGLQHLTGVLAGDLFPTQVSGASLSDTDVVELDLPEDFEKACLDLFRSDRANTIQSIREQFKLGQDEPLLAFSFKPRVGVPFERVKQVTLEVLQEGFHIVELDTRNLQMNSHNLDEWMELGKEASSVGDHVTAFSPNFSLSVHQALPLIERFVSSLPTDVPAVVKVDGGLEGLGTLQGLRRVVKFNNRQPPIVTCYPLLRRRLETALSGNRWVDFLVLSGADIIYPGRRPTFPREHRPIWGDEPTNLRRAAERYDVLTERGWPMPTVAGGIDPGQLQAFYELLGPNVAYFLGGAVALHQDSPKAGAALCVQVMRKTVKRARWARRRHATHARDLPLRLIRGIEEAGYKVTVYNSPANVFKASEVNPNPPGTFYVRQSRARR
jgi:ribulose 1,5-bisphosphate carboxylase large subunit-like protein